MRSDWHVAKLADPLRDTWALKCMTALKLMRKRMDATRRMEWMKRWALEFDYCAIYCNRFWEILYTPHAQGKTIAENRWKMLSLLDDHVQDNFSTLGSRIYNDLLLSESKCRLSFGVRCGKAYSYASTLATINNCYGLLASFSYHLVCFGSKLCHVIMRFCRDYLSQAIVPLGALCT